MQLKKTLIVLTHFSVQFNDDVTKKMTPTTEKERVRRFVTQKQANNRSFEYHLPLLYGGGFLNRKLVT